MFYLIKSLLCINMILDIVHCATKTRKGGNINPRCEKTRCDHSHRLCFEKRTLIYCLIICSGFFILSVIFFPPTFLVLSNYSFFRAQSLSSFTLSPSLLASVYEAWSSCASVVWTVITNRLEKTIKTKCCAAQGSKGRGGVSVARQKKANLTETFIYAT